MLSNGVDGPVQNEGSTATKDEAVETGALGKVYDPGEVIMHQGEVGDSMHVIQEGQVEVVVERGDREVQLAVRGAGEFIGEMAIFEHEARSATVRALDSARILTVDKKTLLRRIHEDPTLAFHMIQVMSRRIRELSVEVAQLQSGQPGSALS
jgi:CRP-like cAMP-binding protein